MRECVWGKLVLKQQTNIGFMEGSYLENTAVGVDIGTLVKELSHPHPHNYLHCYFHT